MDLFGKLIAGLFIIWAGAMVIGLLIALAPLLLVVVGFFLMLGLLTLIGRLVASWFF